MDRTTQPRLGECINKRQIFISQIKNKQTNKVLICILKPANSRWEHVKRKMHSWAKPYKAVFRSFPSNTKFLSQFLSSSVYKVCVNKFLPLSTYLEIMNGLQSYFDHQVLIMIWCGRGGICWCVFVCICPNGFAVRIYHVFACIYPHTQPGRKGKAPSTGVTPLCDGGCQNNGHRERHHVPSFSHEDLDECTVLVAFLSMTLFGCISFPICENYVISFQFRWNLN